MVKCKMQPRLNKSAKIFPRRSFWGVKKPGQTGLECEIWTRRWLSSSRRRMRIAIGFESRRHQAGDRFPDYAYALRRCCNSF